MLAASAVRGPYLWGPRVAGAVRSASAYVRSVIACGLGSLTDRARLVQATKNTITLKGSTEIVTEFFGYSINSILYQVRRACSRDEQFSRPRLLSFRGPHRAIGRARCTCVVTSVSASSEPGGRHVRLVCRVLLVLRTLTMGPECVRIRSAASTRRRALRV